MRFFLALVAGFLVISRLAIENQPVLGIRGTISAILRLDIHALTPVIIDNQHIAVGGLFFASGVLFWARRQTREKMLSTAVFAGFLAAFVTIMEVVIFFARG